jgi:SAM-dependent methyltransferase
MTAETKNIRALRPGEILRSIYRRLRPRGRAALLRLAPGYAARLSAQAQAPARLTRLEAAFEHDGERTAEQVARLEDLAREVILTAESLRRESTDIDVAMKAAARSTRREIELIETELNALPYVSGSPFESMREPVGEVLGYRSAGSLGRGEGSYVGFEELFRGPAERVAELQRPYLALVAGREPVLDVGCGRGEFLALLAGDGIRAHGVDSDAGMIERCHELGLQATLADANEYLQGLEDHSLGVLFSAQLIEHLPYPQLLRLFELARHKLRPGGLFIAETVNPHRVSSLKTFWVDLTHQHPIFPEVALALAAIAGFEPAYVFAPTFDSFEQARLRAPAYALVATVPEPRGQSAPESQGQPMPAPDRTSGPDQDEERG